MRTALWLAFPLNALRNGNATVFVSLDAQTHLQTRLNSAILSLSFPCALKRELHSRQTGTAAILSLNGCALREFALSLPCLTSPLTPGGAPPTCSLLSRKEPAWSG